MQGYEQIFHISYFGWFGGTTGPAMEVEGEQIAIDADGVAAALNDADSVIIIPGYGMASAGSTQFPN